jgi:hypothetical protein
LTRGSLISMGRLAVSTFLFTTNTMSNLVLPQV